MNYKNPDIMHDHVVVPWLANLSVDLEQIFGKNYEDAKNKLAELEREASSLTEVELDNWCDELTTELIELIS
jgi:hypothetical protein